MRLSGGVEWAVHCCVVLTAARQPVPAARLAELHDVSASYLAKQLQALARAGLVRSVQGKSGGYALTRDAREVTVLDVVEAIEGTGRAFACTEIRRRGPLAAPPEACTAPCGVARAMWAAEDAWRASLRGVTVADLAEGLRGRSGTDVLGTVGRWLSPEGRGPSPED